MKKEMPYKLRKHYVLYQFGFKTLNQIDSEIHRYDIKDFAKLKHDIETEMTANSINDSLSTFLVSLIPMKDFYQLPNFSISNIKDLQNLSSTIFDRKDIARYSEIWFFRKSVDKDINSLIGRISFQNKEMKEVKENEQTIEQVWTSNHRILEKLDNSSQDTLYLRASRGGWGRRYSIEKLTIPKDVLQITREDIASQFLEVTKEIEKNREKIEIFMEHLKRIGIREISLEYMKSKQGISFIDWDSENDKKVTDSIVGPNMREELDSIER